MSFLSDGVALLILLADVQQSDRGAGTPQHVPHVHAAEIGKAYQLARGTIDIGATVENQHGLACGWKEGGDGGSLDSVMEAEQEGGCCEDGAGVPGRHKGV